MNHFMSFSRSPDYEDERGERASDVSPVSVPVSVNQSGEGFPAYQAESQRPSQTWRRARRVAWELVQTLVLAAIIFFAVRAMAQNFRVEGASMEPGLHDGQYLLVNKAVYFKIDLRKLSNYLPFVDPGDRPVRFLFRSPERGDVIVFRFPLDPSRDFIKRVIALPGDTIEVRQGEVHVNGMALKEPYITNPGNYDFPQAGTTCERVGSSCRVPEGAYFVLGDNRNNSYDSHLWNFLPEGNIIGQAMVSYWPMGEFGGVGNRSIDVGFIRLPLP